MDLTPPAPVHLSETKEQAEFFEASNFLVAKLTDYCNLACTYCHQDALNGKPVLMPIETLKNAIRMILKPSKSPVVYVQFHGGEPLLCPDEFFREIVAFAKEELETPDRRVEFCIQTNLTKVFPEKLKLLQELKIQISFSMDGSPEINDKMRGGGRRILENWRHMKAEDVESGAICLIQPSNWDDMDEVLKFFEEEGIHNNRFNLMVPDGRGKEVDETSTDKLFNAKKTILNYMLETKGMKVRDITLEKAMERFYKANGAPSSFEYHGCEALYCQAARSLYSINPDGSFYACDRIAESPAWKMGNVNQAFEAKEKAFATRMRKKFHHKDDWWARCEGCDAKKICEFSCSAYYVDKVDTRETECQYTKSLWGYMVSRRDDIREYVARGKKPIYVDEKVPVTHQQEEAWEIQEIANDAMYNSLSLRETLALNKHFQLYKRESQYYLFVFERAKIFEIDEMVAEIALYNGMLPPHRVEEAMQGQHDKGKLKDALNNLMAHVPEVFLKDTQTQAGGVRVG